jgi:hypothetical protein
MIIVVYILLLLSWLETIFTFVISLYKSFEGFDALSKLLEVVFALFFASVAGENGFEFLLQRLFLLLQRYRFQEITFLGSYGMAERNVSLAEQLPCAKQQADAGRERCLQCSHYNVCAFIVRFLFQVFDMQQ